MSTTIFKGGNMVRANAVNERQVNIYYETIFEYLANFEIDYEFFIQKFESLYPGSVTQSIVASDINSQFYAIIFNCDTEEHAESLQNKFRKDFSANKISVNNSLYSYELEPIVDRAFNELKKKVAFYYTIVDKRFFQLQYPLNKIYGDVQVYKYKDNLYYVTGITKPEYMNRISLTLGDFAYDKEMVKAPCLPVIQEHYDLLDEKDIARLALL